MSTASRKGRTTGAPRAALSLADGRRLAWTEHGDPAGSPVLYCHGFPSSADEARFTHDAARRAGARMISPDRPGYGGSTPRASDAVADWVDDAVALLDHLAITPVAVLGVSGGAPYALALAALRPGRVRRVALVAGLGPLAELGGTAGMSGLGRLSFRLARDCPPLQAALFHAIGALIRVAPRLVFRALSAGGPPRDRELVRRPDVQAIWVRAMRGGVTYGADPAIHELRRYARPWRFEVDRIAAPVDLWHGTADRVVPIGHSRYVAQRLGDAHAHWLPGDGHFSAPVGHIEDILHTLLTTA